MRDRTRPDPEARLAALHAAHGRDVLAYALRRTPTPEDAADVVAETFLVAWRRADDVPAGQQARLWLYGVARHVLANQLRAERRRVRLSERLRAELPAALAVAPDPAAASRAGEVLAALVTLGEEDRELLLLTGWEELEPAEVAAVLGLSRVAVRSRLHRARRRLRAALDHPDPARPAVAPERLDPARPPAAPRTLPHPELETTR